MKPSFSILLVEDDAVDRVALLRFIEAERLDYALQMADSVAEARQRLAAQPFDLILLNHSLKHGAGLDLLDAVGRTPVIFITRTEAPEIAVQAMKNGVGDYLLKDREQRYLQLLPVTVERALKRVRAEREREELQTRLLRSQKMEAIGTLSGGIAHEFNNILAIMLSYVELTKLECDNCPTLEANLNEVIKAARRANDIIQQIQTFNQEQPGDRQPMKLEPAVKDVCLLLRNAIPRGVKLEADAVAPNVVIVANRAQVHQVLVNICNNAWQAMPPAGGRIRISTDAVSVDGKTAGPGDLKPGQYVRLSVQDDGCGMDEATLARVVEPFFTTKPLGQGNGLGMSAVHGIMRAHGGAVLLTSKPGTGTTVQLYFPTSAAASGPGNIPDSALPPAAKRQRIMLIDDEPGLLLVNRKFLNRLGHEVLTYERAEPALAAFNQAVEAVDLVITDLNMPGLSGLALVEAMQRLRPELPVILMTGFADEPVLASAQAGKRISVLQKPVLAKQLGEAVQQALGLVTKPA